MSRPALLVVSAALLFAMLVVAPGVGLGRGMVQAQTTDTDGDGIADSTETTFGSDPTSPRSLPEHLGYDPATCSDGQDNDLDGATDSADSGCVLNATLPTPTPTQPSFATPPPVATQPPIATATSEATPPPTATEPSIAQPTASATTPPISSGGPGPDPTASPGGQNVQALPGPTEQPGYAAPPPPDLRITDLELTQGIQDLENHMPLVEGRLTYLRVYVATDEGNWFGVDAVMAAFRNGQQLGLSEDDDDPAVLFAKNGTITAHEDGGDRVNLDDSLYFKLPRYWARGNTSFRVLAYGNGNPNSVDLESDPDNNERQLAVTFREGADANVMLVPIHMHVGNTPEGDVHTYTWEANEQQATSAVNDIFRLNPIPRLFVYGGELEHQVRPLCHGDWCDPMSILDDLPREWDLSDPAQVGDPTLRIKSYKDNTDPWVDGLGWYGMVFNDVDMTMQKQGFDPINISGLASNGVSYGKMSDSYSGDSPWHISRGATLAHELAHNLGLKHVNCSGTEAAGGSVDGSYPYQNPDCSLANVDPAGYYGLDVYYHAWSWLTEPAVISNDPDEADPANGFPLMGYSSPKWVDPFDYCLMLVGYGVDCDLNDLQIAVPAPMREAFVATADSLRSGELHASHDHALWEPPHVPSPLQSAQQFALVYGYINHDTNEAAITHVQRLDDPLQHVIDEALAREAQRVAAGPGQYLLALRDPAGAVVGELALVDFNVPGHEGANALQAFAELVVWPGDVGTIEVQDPSGLAVAARPVSAAAPTVRITSPGAGDDLDAPLSISWDASDPDGDPLFAMVQYSADGGATWRVVVDAVIGNGVEVASLGFMPASDGRGILRVTVNDGVNTGRDEISDLTVPNSGPAPRILGPGSGHRVLQGDLLALEGTATDWEDGAIEGDSLRWTSSIDGDLGRGEVIDLMDLAAGAHTITLAAEDSDGAVGETSIVVTVLETLRPDRSEELRRAAARLDIDLGDPSGDNGGDGFDAKSIAAGAGAGALAMLVLALVVERLLSRRRQRR